MLRKKASVIIDDGREIAINELTVKDMDAALGAIDQKRPSHWAEILLDAKVPVEVVTASTGLTVDEIEQLTPTELSAIWEAVAKVNDFLSRGLDRLGAFAERLDQLKEEASSEESSAS